MAQSIWRQILFFCLGGNSFLHVILILHSEDAVLKFFRCQTRDQRFQTLLVFLISIQDRSKDNFVLRLRTQIEASGSKLSVPFPSPVLVNTYSPLMLIVSFSLFDNSKCIQYFVSRIHYLRSM